MNKLILVSVVVLSLFQSCAQPVAKKEKSAVETVKKEIKKEYVLADYLKEDADLDKDVEKVFAALDDTAIVAQLIMPAVGRLGQTEATIKSHIKDRIIGG
ncbi:MAG: hypothetical protein NWS43_09015, partial [Crocinitomicaceae bacterium]|nr:hypothetical protein [Crocinitomicaceae bacterium]